MRDSWTRYEEDNEIRCTYCGCTKEDEYYIGGDCCCGVEWEIECSNGVELDGFNNVDNILEMKRIK